LKPEALPVDRVEFCIEGGRVDAAGALIRQGGVGLIPPRTSFGESCGAAGVRVAKSIGVATSVRPGGDTSSEVAAFVRLPAAGWPSEAVIGG
jgi:hypothetical protein